MLINSKNACGVAYMKFCMMSMQLHTINTKKQTNKPQRKAPDILVGQVIIYSGPDFNFPTLC